jgi:hypothetical protein
MRTWARSAVAAVTPVLVTGCALPMLMMADRNRICSVGVTEKFEAVSFHPNPLADPVGGPLGGAGLGALAGLRGGLLAIFTVPLGAAIGAIGGGACGAGALAHPDADAKFQAILAEADHHSLARALSAGVTAAAARASCTTAPANAASVRPPDAVVEIDAIEAGMGCPIGKQQLWTSVRWRVVESADGRELAAATTRCTASSAVDFAEWFADTGRARVEIELLLTRTGQRVADQMFAPRVQIGCAAP